MAATIQVFSYVKLLVGLGGLNLSSVPLKASLHSAAYAPLIHAHRAWADVTDELPTGNGYTAGGQALSGVTWTLADGVATLDAHDVVWTAAGGPITARWAVVRAIGTFGGILDPVVALVLLDSAPADMTATDGNPFTLNWNATGIVALA